MKITTYGVIIAAKNLGAWLASYTITGIKADPAQFGYSLIIYALITIPSDLFLLNHVSQVAKKAPAQ